MLLVEQGFDGMWCKEFSEPYEYNNGYEGVQP
jgi:hypothetical protein